MKHAFLSFTIVASFTLSVAGQEESAKPHSENSTRRAPITKKTADPLPEAARKFNGMLVGRLVQKDVEKGTFIINVDAVPRVWRNSKAKSPRSLLTKNIAVDGVFGKWLDVLLLVKEGETLECEARHDGGDGLTFPGELLRKVAPFKPGDYPVLPEEFRGFVGAVSGKIITKNTDLLELIVQVDFVLDSWKGNAARNPKSIVGNRIMVGGFWQRKEQYHKLKEGSRIEVGLKHISRQSDHLSVTEFVREPTSDRSKSGFVGRGFMGALIGTLEEKDVEKGTLALKVQAVPRVWKKNQVRNPKSLIGHTIEIEGIANRFLDTLLTTKKGETLEVAARHDEGSQLTFPGELFRKVAAYNPEDYPVLPDSFRGFHGSVTAEIVKKDQSMLGMIIKVASVDRTNDNSRAKDVSSIVGKTAILAGFWRRKDLYGNLKVGDRIIASVKHEIPGSDVLSVADGVRKTELKE